MSLLDDMLELSDSRDSAAQARQAKSQADLQVDVLQERVSTIGVRVLDVDRRVCEIQRCMDNILWIMTKERLEAVKATSTTSVFSKESRKQPRPDLWGRQGSEEPEDRRNPLLKNRIHSKSALMGSETQETRNLRDSAAYGRAASPNRAFGINPLARGYAGGYESQSVNKSQDSARHNRREVGAMSSFMNMGSTALQQSSPSDSRLRQKSIARPSKVDKSPSLVRQAGRN